MVTSALDKKIQSYLPLLGHEEKQSLLSLIKVFLKLKNENPRFDIEAYNKELEEAVKRIDAGQFYTQEEVEKMSKEW